MPALSYANESYISQDKPPALPSRRSYTIKGNMKLNYPQIRVMKQTYSGELSYSEYPYMILANQNDAFK